jgi:lysine-N-methylase
MPRSQPASRQPARGRTLPILVPEDQRYDCSSCPARCCTSPWGIPVSQEEIERIGSDVIAQARLDARQHRILRAGVLPMVERDRSLRCVFLDDDLLCSLHKARGHAFIPATCQAYPFGFQSHESGRPVALLSRYCPSIRDRRGAAVEPLLAAKLDQAGGARPLSASLGLRSGRVLGKEQFAWLIDAWREVLTGVAVPEALVRLFEATDRFDGALVQDATPSPAALAAAWQKAEPDRPVELRRRRQGFSQRILLAYLLGGLSYPSRVLLPHRTKPISFWDRLRSLGNRLAWLLSLGQVDLYLVPGRVPVGRVARVESVLLGPHTSVVTEYLREVLWRRQGMHKKTYLHRILVDLALMAVVISRHAKAAAAARGAPAANEAEVREAIGVAELLFSHQADQAEGLLLSTLRVKLLSDERQFQNLLSAEL